MEDRSQHPRVLYIQALEKRRRERFVPLANLIMLASVNMRNYHDWCEAKLVPAKPSLIRLKHALNQLEEAMGYERDDPKALPARGGYKN